MHNILLIDDHAVVRKGLKAILEEEFEGVCVDEAGSGHDGIDHIRQNMPDAVVLDISLPDMNGLEVLKRIRMNWPKLPVLILSIYGEDQYGMRMMRAGASGYLAKSVAPERLIAAIKKIIGGQHYLSDRLAERLASNFEKGAAEVTVESLSDREYQVFRMLAAGKTVTEIGNELHLSVKTISTHRHHILAKLKMSTNSDLVGFAHASGLVG